MSSESTRPSRQSRSPVCCSPPASLCVDCTHTSAPDAMAESGSDGWKCRCPPHASSTITIAEDDAECTARAIPRVSAHSPSYVGDVYSTASASGDRRSPSATCSTLGGSSASKRGSYGGGREREVQADA